MSKLRITMVISENTRKNSPLHSPPLGVVGISDILPKGIVLSEIPLPVTHTSPYVDS